MSERLRPTPLVINEVPGIEFDVSKHAELLRSAGMPVLHIHCLKVNFKQDEFPLIKRPKILKRSKVLVTLGEHSPIEQAITIYVYPGSTLKGLNETLLHETKHAIQDSQAIVKYKPLKKSYLGRLSKKERSARKYTRKMMKNPKFNSLITFKK